MLLLDINAPMVCRYLDWDGYRYTRSLDIFAPMLFSRYLDRAGYRYTR